MSLNYTFNFLALAFLRLFSSFCNLAIVSCCFFINESACLACENNVCSILS